MEDLTPSPAAITDNATKVHSYTNCLDKGVNHELLQQGQNIFCRGEITLVVKEYIFLCCNSLIVNTLAFINVFLCILAKSFVILHMLC